MNCDWEFDGTWGDIDIYFCEVCERFHTATKGENITETVCPERVVGGWT